MASYVSIAILVVVSLLLVWLLANALFTVEQQTSAVIERFGRFQRLAGAGLGIKIPLIDRIEERVSLRVQQLDVRVESKSKDNVFVELAIVIQYQVREDRIQDAVYRLTDHRRQIESYVFDVVRAQVPTMTLEEAFENKDSIATAVDTDLTGRMEQYGYEIVNVLVNDIDPDDRVKVAMNEVQAAHREREAAVQRAEAVRITLVKQAEAEAESKKLQGEGLANQRKAIAQGLRDSVELVRGTNADDRVDERSLMDLLLLGQWMDTQKEIASSAKSTVIFMPNNPGAVSDIAQQIRTSILSAEAANLGVDPAPGR